MYRIFTDGACRGNPGIASWAFVVYKNDTELGHKSDAVDQGTNNAMELTAIMEALEHINRNLAKYKAEGVTIFTDSAFCINVITNWMDGWQARGWQKKTQGPIQNLSIIKKIWELWHYIGDNVGNVQIIKVAGHSGVLGNERADELCNKALDKMK